MKEKENVSHEEREKQELSVPGVEENVRAGARSSQCSQKSQGWFQGKYLPHYDELGIVQSITFRLCDSLPIGKIEELKEELRKLQEEKRDRVKRKKIEDWIDAGYGCCALKNPDMAKIMEDALLYFNGNRYDLVCWCIMPNHVHVMISVRYALSKIVQSWKSFSGRWAWEHLDEKWLPAMGTRSSSSSEDNLRAGARSSQGSQKTHKFWMADYWDRYIRNAEHFSRVVEYIHNNPVKAGLCERAEDWLWSSARYWNCDDGFE